jgi:flagellar motor switch protein FliN/FliY
MRKPVTVRVMKLPVPVAVHLAERKIELSQLLSMAPGTLLTFEKSCEDLLDLYVNNQIYARGEAVKIGEKFGLKINELGELSSD